MKMYTIQSADTRCQISHQENMPAYYQVAASKRASLLAPL